MDDKLLKEALRIYAGKEVLNNLSTLGAPALDRKLKQTDVTILTIDLDSFESFPENLSHNQIIELFENYLDACANCIDNSGGIIGLVNGNAIMAFWLNGLGSATKAVNCAIECVKTSSNISIIKGLTLSARIGISSGEVLLGNIGPKSRLQYSIMGAKVNLAWRLQSASKQYKAQILMCDNTEKRIDAKINRVLADKVILVGAPEPLSLYKVQV